MTTTKYQIRVSLFEHDANPILAENPKTELYATCSHSFAVKSKTESILKVILKDELDITDTNVIICEFSKFNRKTITTINGIHVHSNIEYVGSLEISYTKGGHPKVKDDLEIYDYTKATLPGDFTAMAKQIFSSPKQLQESYPEY